MSNQVTVKDKNITENVLGRVNDMQSKREIFFPPNYSPENALKSAWLILQDIETRDKKPVLQACSQNSIANALLDMVVQGLNPMKNQCYFIAYGKNLTLQRSYLGTMAIAKRLPEVNDISFQVIYEGDEIEMSIVDGRREVTKHVQKFENIMSGKIIGAYCSIISKDNVVHTEVMTMEQIKAAWNQGQMKGNSGAHKNFTDQMALKTVINRACKFIVNSSDDSSILTETFARTTKNESPEVQYELLDTEVDENQATEVLDIEAPKEIEQVEYEATAVTEDEELPEFLADGPEF